MKSSKKINNQSLWTMLFVYLFLLVRITYGESCTLCKCENGIQYCNGTNLENQTDIVSPLVTQVYMGYNEIRHITAFKKQSLLTHLSLDHNIISRIDSQAFKQLTNLTYLDLSHNHLTSNVLHPVIFKGVYKNDYETLPLKVLKLGSNVLHTLHKDLFEYLNDLQELYLESNPLKQIDQSTIVAIASLHQLEVLDLSTTMIRDLPSGLFHSPKKLRFLNVGRNLLMTVPSALSEAHNLNHLILTGNPIKVLSSFPTVENLRILEINWMPFLEEIESYALANLTTLEELHCSNNVYLHSISETAFIHTPEDGSETNTYPPLKRLYLNNNRLTSLNYALLKHWEKLETLKMDLNPWSCDCRNQWILDYLIPLIKEAKTNTSPLLCAGPIEMYGKTFNDLQEKNSTMRCLDIYGNHPEKDAKVLVVVLIAILVAIPFALIIISLIKRPNISIRHHSSATYHRAVSLESVVA